MDPLTKGEYPITMQTMVGDRLPKFTKQQSKMVKGSFDFIGLNYYTSRFARDFSIPNRVHESYNTDSLTNQTGTLKIILDP